MALDALGNVIQGGGSFAARSGPRPDEADKTNIFRFSSSKTIEKCRRCGPQRSARRCGSAQLRPDLRGRTHSCCLISQIREKADHTEVQNRQDFVKKNEDLFTEEEDWGKTKAPFEDCRRACVLNWRRPGAAARFLEIFTKYLQKQSCLLQTYTRDKTIERFIDMIED